MARQLQSFYKNFLSMTADEQRAVVERVRYNKYTAKPAVKTRQVKAKKKTQRKASKKLEGLIAQLSPEQIAALKKQHGLDK